MQVLNTVVGNPLFTFYDLIDRPLNMGVARTPLLVTQLLAGPKTAALSAEGQ